MGFVKRSNTDNETKTYTSVKGDRIAAPGTNTNKIPTIKKNKVSLHLAYDIIKIVQYVLAVCIP
ncbi:MAG: hypothetical protein WB988_15675 [Candidatus Nitrosopolaris sp.]